MGWWFQHRERGVTDREFFMRQSASFAERVRGTATVSRQVFHAALTFDAHIHPELVPGEDGKVVACFVALIKWVPNDYANFGYKDMDEFMGPAEAVCPASVLDLLSPFKPEALEAAEKEAAWQRHRHPEDTPYLPLLSAKAWRDRCHKLIAVRAAIKQGAKFKVDRPADFPLRFSDGIAATELTVGPIVNRRHRWFRQDGVGISISQTHYRDLVPLDA